MKEKWIEISVRVPEELSGIVKSQLKELGSEGIVEDSFGDKGEPVLHEPLVKGYFNEADDATREKIKSFNLFIASLASLFPNMKPVKVEEIVSDEDDWQKWKLFFKTRNVSKRIVIKPTWEDYSPKAEEVIIELDPGMAFGTGTHETTRLCIQLLDENIKGRESVFDVGTGSGILSIAAAKLGAGEIYGIDYHSDSVRIAGENVILNGVEQIVKVSDEALEDVKGNYDVVVANILAEPLVEMSKILVARAIKGGKVILSGILMTKADMVVEAYEASGVKLEKKLDEGEWSALLFSK